MVSGDDMMTKHRKRLDFLGFGDAQKALLKSLQPTVRESIDAALETFYEKVRATPETARFFREEAG